MPKVPVKSIQNSASFYQGFVCVNISSELGKPLTLINKIIPKICVGKWASESLNSKSVAIYFSDANDFNAIKKELKGNKPRDSTNEAVDTFVAKITCKKKKAW